MKSQIVFLIVCILNVSCGNEKKSPVDPKEISLLEAPILIIESIGDGEVSLS